MNLELILKTTVLNIFTYLINSKIINNKKINYIKIILASILTTVTYIILRNFINNVFTIIIQYLIQVLFLKIIVEDKKQSFIVSNLLANSISYVGFVVSTFIESIFKYSFMIKDNLNNIAIILIIEAFMLNLIFKLKRINQGFAFLKDKVNNEYIDIIIIDISLIIIFIYSLFGNYYGNLTKQLSICSIILAIIMVIVIQKTLNLYYKQKLLVKTIEENKATIKAKDEEIKQLSDEKFKISKLNHEFYNRQKALMNKVNDFVNNCDTEAGAELSVVESINKLSKEYSSKLESIKSPDKLPVTGIEEIDDMFKYMQSECLKNNIEFNLKINSNIYHLVNNIISQEKLVTLIGDHIRDAIIAVNFSNNKFKSILAILGKKNNYYEFCVYDTGIEFEIDTLIKLGLEPATTHKDTGGTGIGFITTFETMKETKASLIIKENKLSENDYTKSVTIRFDGNNEYRICSYREDEIKKKDTKDRIKFI